MKLAIVILVVVVLLVLWLAGTYNGLVKKKNAVEEAFSTMDVYLKKRWDLIPNLVNTVKGYAAHEAQTLQNVVTARAGSYAVHGGEVESQCRAFRRHCRVLCRGGAVPGLKGQPKFFGSAKPAAPGGGRYCQRPQVL